MGPDARTSCTLEADELQLIERSLIDSLVRVLTIPLQAWINALRDLGYRTAEREGVEGEGKKSCKKDRERERAGCSENLIFFVIVGDINIDPPARQIRGKRERDGGVALWPPSCWGDGERGRDQEVELRTVISSGLFKPRALSVFSAMFE